MFVLPGDVSLVPIASSVDGEVVVRGCVHRDSVGVDVAETALYRCEGRVVRASPSAGAEVGDVIHSYHSTVLPLLAQALEPCEAVHASAVRTQAGVVAFCGPSGIGKSTIAQALAARGLPQWAEDAVVVERRDGGVVSRPLPFTFPPSDPATAVEPVEPAASHPVPLAAIHVLDPVRRGSTAIERMSPGEALTALLPNAHRFRPAPPDRERETAETYLALVEAVPVFRLRFVRGRRRLDALADAVLESRAA